MTLDEYVKQAKTNTDATYAIKYLVHRLVGAGLFRSCVNCGNWDSANESCMLFRQRPPAPVIVTGCEKHTDIFVPY